MARLVAALSGGVDSAVAAARALEAGHDVTGVHLALLRDPVRTGDRGCCSLQDANDARRVADVLGIPFYVWDFSEAFQREVVDDFVAEYTTGRTPNPCLRCNRTIKFAALLDRAVALGFDGVVTGHYARLVRGEAVELHRAVDTGKDQSYVLGVLDQEQLSRAWFPLGESTKAQVRAEAATRGLRVAHKPDSTDICFVPDGDVAGWLRERLGERPGPIVDDRGQVVGAHAGTYGFTIGQRKGLRLRSPAADGAPRYVLGLDPETATVRVGPREALRVDALTCGTPVWCSGPPAGVDSGFRAGVQVRAHAPEVPATVRLDSGHGRIHVDLDEPVYGVAPGQTAVFYDGTRVVGSAVIDATGLEAM